MVPELHHWFFSISFNVAWKRMNAMFWRVHKKSKRQNRIWHFGRFLLNLNYLQSIERLVWAYHTCCTASHFVPGTESSLILHNSPDLTIHEINQSYFKKQRIWLRNVEADTERLFRCTLLKIIKHYNVNMDWKHSVLSQVYVCLQHRPKRTDKDRSRGINTRHVQIWWTRDYQHIIILTVWPGCLVSTIVITSQVVSTDKHIICLDRFNCGKAWPWAKHHPPTSQRGRNLW